MLFRRQQKLNCAARILETVCFAIVFYSAFGILCVREIIKFSKLTFVATEKTSKPAARSTGTYEEGKVNTCGCKQCEYFKALEREVLYTLRYCVILVVVQYSVA